MSFLIDSDVAVHLRDGDETVTGRLADLETLPALSALSQVELEGGIVRVPKLAATRRVHVDNLLAQLRVLPFDGRCADAYGRIVTVTGWSRPRIFDRMIAATALVHDLTLITMNGRDFREIPGLRVMVWPSPA